MTNIAISIIIAISAVIMIYLTYLLSSSQTPKNQNNLQITLKDMLKQIENLYNQKKYDIVENVAIEYLKNKPDAIEVREYLAKAYFSRDKIYDAISTIMQILEKQKKNLSMHTLLAKCYKKINQMSKAITEYKFILELEPENSIAARDLAEIYLSQNQKLSAIKMYKKYEKYIENNGELLNIKKILIGLYIELKQFNEAFNELAEIREIYPDDIELNKILIELYITQKDIHNAIKTCESLLMSTQDEHFTLWLLQNLVNLYHAIKNYDNALVYADKLLEHPFSNKVEAKALIAKIYILQGDFAKGIEYLLALENNNPNNIDIKKMIAQAYIVNKDYTNAVDTYKEILDLVPPKEVSSVHSDISNLYVDWAINTYEENLEECFKLFQLAIKYDASNSKIHINLGKVNVKIKNYNEAILNFKKSLELEPNQSDCYVYLADCYGHIENIYDEKISLLHAIKCDSENIQAYYKLAKLYAKQRDIQNELETLQKVIQLDSNHLEARHKLALIYEAQGQVDMAIEMYESILKRDPENKIAQTNLNTLTNN